MSFKSRFWRSSTLMPLFSAGYCYLPPAARDALGFHGGSGNYQRGKALPIILNNMVLFEKNGRQQLRLETVNAEQHCSHSCVVFSSKAQEAELERIAAEIQAVVWRGMFFKKIRDK